MASRDKVKTYRVRQLSGRLKRSSHVARLLAEVFDDVDPEDIKVFSLATSLNPLEIPATKVATVTFSHVPHLLDNDETEWVIPGEPHDLVRDIIVDIHFQDFTPLNDVPQDEHELDCIAISGLASHPFGSWKNRSRHSTFMWLRDRLPKELPNVRSIIYGYDTALIDSESIKGVDDIAVAFIRKMKAIGKSGPSAKPLLMLAHSLGGIVLKQAMVMMARTEDHNKVMLDSIRGVVFFGVPNKGMKVSHLLPMVQDRPNADIVNLLSTKSDYLQDLDAQFSGIVQHRDMEILSVYETRRSPTTQKDSKGRWRRDGPPDLLVDKSSAIQEKSSLDLPVDEDHSNLVKFAADDQDCQAIIDFMNCAAEKTQVSKSKPREIQWNSDSSDDEKDPGDDIVVMRNSLNVDETGHRLDEIASQYKSTFEWIFDDDEVGFADWLKDDRGLFWISGKPGSGKSTLMKLALQDYRTFKLFNLGPPKATTVIADYFFHDRGSSMQKSLEGLLSRILRQFMVAEKELAYLALPYFLSRPEDTRQNWSLHDLRQVLEIILAQKKTDYRILLFIDALDEFDGEPETVVEFIKDLLRRRPGSGTKVKICCSSRPWNVFKDTFSDAAGCKVHEMTTGDIERYIDGRFETNTSMKEIMLQEDSSGGSHIEDLKAELSKRAEGVFIWVRLVLDELLKACTDGAMPQELMETLSSFPDDLDKSYQRLIDRIPSKYRFESYALIEIVLRSKDPFGLRDLGIALQCALGDSPEDCIKRLPADPYSEEFMISMKRRLQSRCGGMLEVLADTTVQFMHQTAKEYFSRPGSTEAILEHDRKLSKENGYSFLAKFWLSLASAPTVHFDWKAYIWSMYSKFGYSLKPHYHYAYNIAFHQKHRQDRNSYLKLGGFYLDSSSDRCIEYAYLAERTTGHSQREFFDQLEDEVFRQVFRCKESKTSMPRHGEALLSFAEAASLRLYLAEVRESSRARRAKRDESKRDEVRRDEARRDEPSKEKRSRRKVHQEPIDESSSSSESEQSSDHVEEQEEPKSYPVRQKPIDINPRSGKSQHIRRYIAAQEEAGSYISEYSYPSPSSSSRRRGSFQRAPEVQPGSYRSGSYKPPSLERVRPRRKRREPAWPEYAPEEQGSYKPPHAPELTPEESQLQRYERPDEAYPEPESYTERQSPHYTTEAPSYPIPRRRSRNSSKPHRYQEEGHSYNPFQQEGHSYNRYQQDGHPYNPFQQERGSQRSQAHYPQDPTTFRNSTRHWEEPEDDVFDESFYSRSYY